jgi:hypothetical protein
VFFNTKEVENATDKAERRVLARFGYLTMKGVKKSMRRRKKGPSEKGKPPRVVTGLLKRYILFGYDKFKQSVVTGAARIFGFKDAGIAPEVLETGELDRPFVRPEFKKQLQLHMPGMWKDSIR